MYKQVFLSSQSLILFQAYSITSDDVIFDLNPSLFRLTPEPRCSWWLHRTQDVPEFLVNSWGGWTHHNRHHRHKLLIRYQTVAIGIAFPHHLANLGACQQAVNSLETSCEFFK